MKHPFHPSILYTVYSILFRRRRALLAFGIVLLLALTPLIYWIIKAPTPAQADWFDGNWQYRKVIPISSHTAAETNEYIAITAYDASDTTRYQTDCGDVRFTKSNGELLPYTVTSCGASTTFNVLFDSFPAGAQDIYLYYGNGFAPNGFQTAAFATEASNYALGTVGSETTTPGPIANWKFDEGQGTTTQDQTTHNNDGTISGATWTDESRCISGKCLLFDGSNDVVTISNSISGIKTISFWVKSATTTEYFVDLDGGTNYISASSGTVSATGFTSPTYYIDGVAGATTITANKWHHIAVVTSTAETGSAITIGKTGANFHQGFIDEVKIYPYARSAAEVKSDFNQGSGNLGKNNSEAFSEGLVGYWKLDESSGTAADSSGNSLTLTNNATTTYVAGKFGSGSEHVPASLQYLNTATTIAGVKTVSFWVNPDVTGNYYIDLDGGTNYIADSGGTLSATGFTSPTIYVNGAVSSTVTANVWQLVTITTNTAISASAFALGKIGSNYFDGTMDEVRLYNRSFSPLEVRQLYNFAPGPIGHWNFDEGTGTSTADDSGNANTGTITDPTWVNGKLGKALSFNGTSTEVNIGDTDNVSGMLTVSAWIKPNTVSGSWDAIYGESGFGFYNKDGVLTLWTSAFSGGTGTLTINQWQHVAATFDSSTDSIYFYINGIQVYSKTNWTGTVLNDTNTEFIGSYNGSQEWFSGLIDEVKIYNYPRTPQQVVEDMNAGHPTGGSPIGTQTAYYRLDEQQGNTANNAVSTSYAGTRTNATWKTKSSCKINGCMYFDGTGDFVDIGTGPTVVNTVSFWVNPDTTTESIIDLNGSAYISVSSGTLSATGFTSPTIYINGKVSTTLAASSWQHVAITTATSLNATDLDLGRLEGTDDFAGYLDDVKFYTSPLTIDQISIDMNANAAVNFGTTASSEQSDLTDGADDPPVLEMKLDENTGTTTNSTSGTFTGTLTTGPTWATGKIGRAVSFDGSDDFVDIGTGPTSVKTVEFWVYPTTTTEYPLDLNGTAYVWINAGTVTAQGFTSATIYVNGRVSSTVTAGSWQHVSVTTATALNASDLDIGRIEGVGNHEGKIDHVVLYDYTRTAAQVAYDYNRGAPIAWWKLDECQGTVANDSSGNGYNGTITIGASGEDTVGTCATSSTSWGSGATGKYSASLDLDGTDDYIDMGNILNFTSTAFTLSAWVYNQQNPALNSGSIINKDNTVGAQRQWRLLLATDNTIRLFVRSGSGSNVTRDSVASIPANAWSHVAATYDPVGQTMHTYVNGVLSDGALSNTVPTSLQSSSVSVRIGAGSASESGRWLQGKIDDVRVYGYALSATQIKKVMNEGSAVRFGP